MPPYSYRGCWDDEDFTYARPEKYASLADFLSWQMIVRDLRYKVHQRIIEWALEKNVEELSSYFFSSYRAGKCSKTCAHLSPVTCSELTPKTKVLCIQRQGNRYVIAEHFYKQCNHPDFVKGEES